MRNSKPLNSNSAITALADQHRQSWEVGQAVSDAISREANGLFENRICSTYPEVAFALGISQKSVERLVRRGELKIKRVGRRVLIPRSDIEAWLNQKE